MPNLHGNDFIAYVDHTKNIMFKQRIYPNYLPKFKRLPLETTNLHRRWLDLWRIYMATVNNAFQKFTTALWCQLKAPCHLSIYFPFLLFSETKKSIFTGIQNNFFTYFAAYFPSKRHRHVEKTVRQIFYPFLYNNFCTCSSNLNYLH